MKYGECKISGDESVRVRVCVSVGTEGRCMHEDESKYVSEYTRKKSNDSQKEQKHPEREIRKFWGINNHLYKI